MSWWQGANRPLALDLLPVDYRPCNDNGKIKNRTDLLSSIVGVAAPEQNSCQVKNMVPQQDIE